MKAESLFRMPLFVVVVLWLLNRRAVNRLPNKHTVVTSVINVSDELIIFEHVEALLAERGSPTKWGTWIDRALLLLVSRRRRDVNRAARLGWMVIGTIPKGKD